MLKVGGWSEALGKVMKVASRSRREVVSKIVIVKTTLAWRRSHLIEDVECSIRL